ncbi:MAG: DsbA family protein [Sphingomicrobium sp.]
MKPSYFLLAAATMLASAACNAEQQGRDSRTADSAATENVQPPADGDWSQIVTQTSGGAFRMGNPNAEVRLIEFASMTCPHCATFDETGVQPLIDNYVKGGQVSFELRNYVRDPFDITASLIARCNGAQSFFPLTRALFDDQEQWISSLQTLPQSQLQGLTNLPPERQFLEIAKAANLQQWAAMRGVPTAKSTQCLTDQSAVTQLVQMNSDATSEYPELPGTPAFAIDGELLENVTTWEQLEPRIREAVGN